MLVHAASNRNVQQTQNGFIEFNLMFDFRYLISLTFWPFPSCTFDDAMEFVVVNKLTTTHHPAIVLSPFHVSCQTTEPLQSNVTSNNDDDDDNITVLFVESVVSVREHDLTSGQCSHFTTRITAAASCQSNQCNDGICRCTGCSRCTCNVYCTYIQSVLRKADALI